ncbi:chemotaxis protein, cheA [Ligilactobacillus salitolerans]|uniref:Chemotaxis protein CheA n=1 Tax=Ligilactobacillus salitolerans TaxID=1808352 RepID=A0A401ITS2_9LACO|nr:chemotaxis protein CheA [Ligilactobacillus salitolerans]GBG94908.1 chemotaxis protein, cheA [Ligilactobacillus salitolerans]
MADDNSVYRDIFFEESEDNLQQLNDNILELENEPENKDLINEIFRAAHTLKGMSATMGYNVMSKLTHKMEDIFDLFKSDKLKVTSDHISLIFRCLDKLTELLDGLRDDEEQTDALIMDLWNELDEVEKQVASGAPVSAEIAAAMKEAEITNPTKDLQLLFSALEDADLDVIEQAKVQHVNAISAAVRIDPESMLKGPRAFLVIEKLDNEGDIIHTEPAPDKLEDGEFETDFKLVILTESSPEQIKELIESSSEIAEVITAPFDEKTQVSKITQPENPAAEQTATSQAPEATQKQTAKTVAKKNAAHGKNTKNQSIRVDLSRLDRFLNVVSELVVYRNQLEDANSRQNVEEAHESLEQVSRLTSELQDLVLKIRMQQVNVVFSRFPRMVRDLSNQLNKKMALEIEGEDTELDKTVVSELNEPLIHLVRNSADHGIEDAETRKRLGKPEEGKIKLSAYQEGNKVLITLTDDGQGLNPQVMKETAEKRGIDTTGMSDKELQMLVFDPGFSTAKKITNISGRGVGLDAVQAKIDELGGSLEVESKVDVGTKTVIKLPLTLSIIQALMVKLGDETFAIPLDVVERVEMIQADNILQTASQEVYPLQTGLTPVIRTARVLGLPENESSKKYMILIKSDEKNFGIVVDQLIGQQEIVIKKIDPMLQQVKRFQGATILGNGSIALILDVNTICKGV